MCRANTTRGRQKHRSMDRRNTRTLTNTICPLQVKDEWYWLWHRCVRFPQAHKWLCGACRHRRAAGELQEVAKESPGWAKRTRTPRDSCHGDCGRKQRLAQYSENWRRERKVWYDKLCNSNLKAKGSKIQISIKQHRSTSNINLQVLLSTYWCAQIHDCAESEPGKRQRGSSKKIICTNLVYFQSVITMTLRLPLFHSHSPFPWCFLPTDGLVV